jgi:hypothetical protein
MGPSPFFVIPASFWRESSHRQQCNGGAGLDSRQKPAGMTVRRSVTILCGALLKAYSVTWTPSPYQDPIRDLPPEYSLGTCKIPRSPDFILGGKHYSIVDQNEPYPSIPFIRSQVESPPTWLLPFLVCQPTDHVEYNVRLLGIIGRNESRLLEVLGTVSDVQSQPDISLASGRDRPIDLGDGNPSAGKHFIYPQHPRTYILDLE